MSAMRKPRQVLQRAVSQVLRVGFRAITTRRGLADQAVAETALDLGPEEPAQRKVHKSLVQWDHFGDGPAKPKPLTTGQVGPTARDLPRILLLNPPSFEGMPVIRLYRSEYIFVQGNNIPVVDLGYFAARLKGKAHIALIDANAEGLDQATTLERIKAFAPDTIVLKGVKNLLAHDLEGPAAYKRAHPHVRIVLSCRGAVDSDAHVFETFPFVDGFARGEVDAFAEDLAAGGPLDKIVGMSTPGAITKVTRTVADLNEFPMPDLEAMPAIWYSGYKFPYYGIPSGYYLMTSRGCPYQCTFCMVGGIEDRPFKYRRRDPENVIEELKLVKAKFGLRDFYFFDEIFTMPGHAEKICELMIKEDLRMSWTCEGKPDLVKEKMLGLMKRAGCTAIYYGVESGDDDILRNVEKGHTSEDARRAIKLTREAGILAGAYIILGFPGETTSSVLRTTKFLLDAKPDMIRYSFLMPYPATVMHREMVDAGLLKPDFDRKSIDRHINADHDLGISHTSEVLSQRQLKSIDALFRMGFATELARSPRIPTEY